MRNRGNDRTSLSRRFRLHILHILFASIRFVLRQNLLRCGALHTNLRRPLGNRRSPRFVSLLDRPKNVRLDSLRKRLHPPCRKLNVLADIQARGFLLWLVFVYQVFHSLLIVFGIDLAVRCRHAGICVAY